MARIEHARLTHVHAEKYYHHSLQAGSILREVGEIEDGLQILWAFPDDLYLHNDAPGQSRA
jgi:hypothetical protein